MDGDLHAPGVLGWLYKTREWHHRASIRLDKCTHAAACIAPSRVQPEECQKQQEQNDASQATSMLVFFAVYVGIFGVEFRLIAAFLLVEGARLAWEWTHSQFEVG